MYILTSYMHVYTGTQLHRKMIAHNDTATTYSPCSICPITSLPNRPTNTLSVVAPQKNSCCVPLQLLSRQATMLATFS